ncbi:MjaI family restriction endonuclease [Rufibacter ruber]|uniref:MjaI family restriction endonuclease n=1 Tax=Rufibacter ruber TaxID=1783499 RepID=UPI00082F59B7|nr:MjaI family restriction endonuclease [Rufibacter ruber]
MSFLTTDGKFRNEKSLNLLFNSSRVNNASKTVYMMDLKNRFNPKTLDELEALFNQYSKMNLDEASQYVYDFQTVHFSGESRHSLEEIKLFVYDVFIRRSMRGGDMETKAKNHFNATFSGDTITFKTVPTDFDSKYAVDLVYGNSTAKCVGAIQIKPETYKGVDPSIIKRDTDKNTSFTEKYDKKVHWLYYNSSGQFSNFYEIVDIIKDELNTLKK